MVGNFKGNRMSLKFSHFQLDRDYDNQRKLFGLSFPETLGTSVIEKQHYHWKFFNFPFTPPAYQYICENADNGMVGYYAAIPYPYQINFKQYRAGMVCDVMTHPEERGKGIFTKIGSYATNELKNEGISFTTGYPIRKEVIPGHLKVGWKIVQPMPMYLRLLGIKSFLPDHLKFIDKIIRPIIILLQEWIKIFRPKNYEAKTLSRQEFFELVHNSHSPLSFTYQSFLDKWLNEQKNALIKSVDFLNWRTHAPHTDYYFILLKQGQELVGFSTVTPTLLKGINSMAVLDFMVLKGHWGASTHLHSAVWNLAKKLGKDVIVCMSSKLWAYRYRFFYSFYLKTPKTFFLIVKKLKDSLSDEELFSSERWHLFWIDSDDL